MTEIEVFAQEISDDELEEVSGGKDLGGCGKPNYRARCTGNPLAFF